MRWWFLCLLMGCVGGVRPGPGTPAPGAGNGNSAGATGPWGNPDAGQLPVAGEGEGEGPAGVPGEGEGEGGGPVVAEGEGEGGEAPPGEIVTREDGTPFGQQCEAMGECNSGICAAMTRFTLCSRICGEDPCPQNGWTCQDAETLAGWSAEICYFVGSQG